MREDNVKLIVGIKEISPLLRFDRPNKPSFIKVNVTLSTMTDRLIFAEVRKTEILEDIEEGDVAEVELSFAGSQKGDKKYNNIFINSITKK